MLSEKQILEIREHMENAQNPLFFYDNDADGFCSYVLFRRFLGRGKGVAVRTHPDIDAGYIRKVVELKADYIFVLDRPHLGEKFIQEVKELNLPIVWLDHHDKVFEEFDYEGIFAYNPNWGDKKSSEPTTYWTYRATGLKEDLWIALMGCVADHYLPNFASEFGERYPEFWGKNIEMPFDAYYKTGIGRLAQALAFGLKDSVTHVIQLQNFMVSCKSPSDIYLELEANSAFGKKYREIRKKYGLLIDKAKKNEWDSLIFFTYGGDLSMSSEISNELSYNFPGKVIVVAYNNGNMSNVSIRGDNVKKLIEKILKDFEDSSGGGHRDAVGARVRTEDLERFKDVIINELKLKGKIR